MRCALRCREFSRTLHRRPWFRQRAPPPGPGPRGSRGCPSRRRQRWPRPRPGCGVHLQTHSRVSEGILLKQVAATFSPKDEAGDEPHTCAIIRVVGLGLCPRCIYFVHGVRQLDGAADRSNAGLRTPSTAAISSSWNWRVRLPKGYVWPSHLGAGGVVGKRRGPVHPLFGPSVHDVGIVVGAGEELEVGVVHVLFDRPACNTVWVGGQLFNSHRICLLCSIALAQESSPERVLAFQGAESAVAAPRILARLVDDQSLCGIRSVPQSLYLAIELLMSSLIKKESKIKVALPAKFALLAAVEIPHTSLKISG